MTLDPDPLSASARSEVAHGRWEAPCNPDGGPAEECRAAGEAAAPLQPAVQEAGPGAASGTAGRALAISR